jgi:hypothetical protein
MIIMTVSQKTVSDTAGFDMQPRHLLHARPAAVEKDLADPTSTRIAELPATDPGSAPFRENKSP